FLYFLRVTTSVISIISLHDALPISGGQVILDTAGYVSGREEGNALLAQAKAHGVRSPESLPAAILTAVEETNMGYGKITIDDIKDRKSTRLNSSHQINSYAVLCLKR